MRNYYAGTDVGALWTTSGDAKEGIRTARMLQATYQSILSKDPSVVKYKPLVDPVVADADAWDKALVFYTDEQALLIGRRAQEILQQMSAEYSRPFAGSQSLAPGPLENTGKSVGDAMDRVAKALPWILGVGAVLFVGSITLPIAIPAISAALARRRTERG